MQTRIQKWGNSLGLRIPKAFAEEAGVEAGSEVDLSLEDGELIIRPKRVPKYDLSVAAISSGCTSTHRWGTSRPGGDLRSSCLHARTTGKLAWPCFARLPVG